MFKRNPSQLLYLTVAIVFFLTFSIVNGVVGNKGPIFKSLNFNRNEMASLKPTINTNTVIKKEISYACGDTVSTAIPTSDLVGLDFAGLSKKFPQEEGWSIDDSKKDTLIIKRNDQRVCPLHQQFRHLGVSEGYLAVFEGPLGYNQKILQREEIAFSTLPPEMQADLNLVMNYYQQPSDIKARLKTAYEFPSEAQLNTVLENFDEFREQP